LGNRAPPELALAGGVALKRDYLFKLFEEARRLIGHRDYVIVGSLSILGSQDEDGLPLEMSMSNDIDSFAKSDPGRLEDVQAMLGEGSDFHRANGYFLDPVSPKLPSLPDGWESRMTRIERDGLCLWFLDPADAAISKYARSAPNDRRWIRAGILAGLVPLEAVRSRIAATTFLDAEEEERVRRQVDADLAWHATTNDRSNPP